MANGMKVSMVGALTNAARTIDGMTETLRNHLGEEEFEAAIYEHQPDCVAFNLREIARHAKETKDGEHAIEQFAEFYCLKDEP